jgi:hypothetical protein
MTEWNDFGGKSKTFAAKVFVSYRSDLAARRLISADTT